MSAEAQALYAVDDSQLFCLVAWTSVGLTGETAAIAGETLGARQPERSRQALPQAARMSVVIAVVVGSLFLTISEVVPGLFALAQPDTVRIGTELLAHLSVSGLFITVPLTSTSGLQRAGHSYRPIVHSARFAMCAANRHAHRAAGVAISGWRLYLATRYAVC